MHVVVSLEQPVLLDDPCHLRPHVGPQNCGGYLSVIVRRELVADVVNQCGHYELVVGAVVQRSGRRLQ